METGPDLKPCWFKEFCKRRSETYCPVCQEIGYHFLVDKAFIERTCIPDEYLYVELRDLKLIGDVEQVYYYFNNIWDLASEGKGTYLYGRGTGTGKTSVSCIFLRRFLAQSIASNPNDFENRRVLYINTTEFLDRLRKSFTSPDDELEILLRELTDVKLAPRLILFDDLGAEKSTEWVMERLYMLINFRVSHKLASLFTSNLPIEELEDKLGKRIVSRILGCSKPLYLGGPDHRYCDWDN